MNFAKLVTITPNAEAHIAYCARVSSPNQENREYEKLLRYCIRKKHWSIFEMAHMVVEINTTRAISAQILRHRSFSFQEFSQRYAPVPQTIYLPLQRMAGATNRQSSLDLPDEFTESQEKAYNDANDAVVRAFDAYQCLLANGFATETARMVLPMSSSTRLYMAGNIRDWLHYVDVRTQDDTQAEHRVIANDIKLIIEEQLPTIHEAMWGKD